MKQYLVLILLFTLLLTTYASANIVSEVVKGVEEKVGSVISKEVDKIEEKIDEFVVEEIRKVKKALIFVYITVILINMVYSTILIFAVKKFLTKK